jgi:hypothetical protein
VTAAVTAQLVGSTGDFEVWALGRVAFVVPAINDAMPPDLKDALATRRAAMLTGTCACGAQMLLTIDPGGHPAAVRMDHEVDCAAHDRQVRDLLNRHGWRLRA